MNQSIETARRERIDAVLALAAPRVAAEQRPHIEAFARVYLHHLDADDLAARTPEDLLGALLSCWQFAAERTPGVTKLRVISPTLAEQGWASRHTVIEVVNDDMPFLVDTTTMEINRQGLTLHLIVHPVLVVQRDAQGRLQSAAAVARGRAGPAGAARIVDACRGRPAGRSRSLRAELAAGLERVLADVRAAVQDWRPMLAHLHEAIAELEQAPPSLPPALVAESRAFLQWLADDHLTLARLPPPRPGQRPGRGPVAPGGGQRPGRAARDAAGAGGEPFPRRLAAGRTHGHFGEFRRRAGAGARDGPRADAAAAGDALEHALHRAPARLQRLRRRQALQRRRRSHRRAPLPRPVHLHRLQRARQRDSAAAPQGGGRGRARRVARWRAPGQGAGAHPVDLPARRPVPDRRGRALRHRAWASCRPASASACACSSGATRTSASSPAWCTCRARPIPPSCARSSRRS